jgi:hypothetical protein
MRLRLRETDRDYLVDAIGAVIGSILAVAFAIAVLLLLAIMGGR